MESYLFEDLWKAIKMEMKSDQIFWKTETRIHQSFAAIESTGMDMATYNVCPIHKVRYLPGNSLGSK